MIERISEMRRRKDAGFTLIELLVVIVILGILAAVVVFAVNGVQNRGQEAAYAADVETLRNAQETFCAQRGTYAENEGQLVTAGLLSTESDYHNLQRVTGPGGTCGGTSYTISCNVAETGCGAGGALASGGTLLLPGSNSGLQLNPAVNTQGGMQNSAGLIFSGLLELDQNGNPVPELATAVPTAANGGITNGGKTYTFNLATAKFHDFATSNQFVKASDVKFSFESAVLRYHARALSSLKAALSQPCTEAPAVPSCPSIVADDTAKTVTFNFANTYAPILAQLAHTDGAIIPKHIWPNCYTDANADGNSDGECPTQAVPWPAGQDPVAAGPFKYGTDDSFTNGDGLRADGYHFGKNPYYTEFRTGLPVFDEVHQKFGITNAFQELKNGTIDVATLTGTNLAALRATPDPNIVVTSGTMSGGGSTNCTLKVIYNLWNPGGATTGVPNPALVGTPGTVDNVKNNTAAAHPMLGDVRVRKAIAHAVDRSTWINDIFLNDGSKLASSPINSTMAWASGNHPIPAFNTTDANTLLDAAGWTGRDANNIRQKTITDVNGDPLTLTMKLQFSGFSGTQISVLNRMDQNLQAVGVDFDVVTDTATAMNGRYANRNFDGIMFSNCQGTDPEVGMTRVYKAASISTAAFTNGAGYKNSAVDTAFADAAAELNQADRAPHYATAATQLAADLPTLWVVETVSNKGHRTNCSGFKHWTGHYAEAANCRR